MKRDQIWGIFVFVSGKDASVIQEKVVAGLLLIHVLIESREKEKEKFNIRNVLKDQRYINLCFFLFAR